jgi:zinc protease
LEVLTCNSSSEKKNKAMKRLTLILAAFLLPLTAIFAGGTEEFRVNGLKVIHRQTPKDVISVRLFIKGGTANYTKANEGIEQLALELAIQGGTETLDKVAFQTKAEQIGAQFSSGTTYDFGNLSMTCIKPYWEESWNLFVDAVLNPAMNTDEFELIRSQALANAKSASSDPDSHLRNIAMINAFGESNNYGKIPSGSEGSIEGLKLADVKAHYEKIIGKKSTFLVIVGNISTAELKSKLEASLGKMDQGRSSMTETRTLITEDGHYVEHRDIATNYIRGLMSAPQMAHPDGVPMRVAMSIMGDRYFEELRTTRSLSYAPAAFYSAGVVNNPYNAVYISTTDPKQSMEVMVAELNKVKENGFEEKELKDKKQTFLTFHYMGLETSASQSNSLGMAELSGNWKLAEEFTDKVNEVKLKDINRVLDNYTKAIKWTYLGKQEEVKKEDFRKTKEVSSERKPY